MPSHDHPQILCDVSWGTHACMLPEDHLGDCICMDLVYEHPWIWMDTGGYCNWWEGKEIGFLHQVCSYRKDYLG